MESFPRKGSPVPRVHPLEIPFVWFGLQFIELAVVSLLLRALLPSDSTWVVWVPIWLVVVVVLTVVNYRIRRRFIPR